ncbi:MAG: LPS export ABC transporter periplasmic protein LptC [Rugosibacter sp.]|jgi:lipopolysaccharide export system protein LptC|nr:lipopolysaccharide export system protein LptC [Rugosibacter sp.]
MNSRPFTLAPLLIMALLAGLTYWLNQFILADGKPRAMRHDPDYIISNFNVRRFDSNGQLQHSLIADKMTHYPDDDTSIVVNPHLINHRQPQTDIFAQQALVGKESKEVDFINDVRVVRQGTAAKPIATVMETRLLKVFPDDETAYTLTPATITQGKSVVQGSHLEVNNKTGISVLHGRVTGTLYRN